MMKIKSIGGFIGFVTLMVCAIPGEAAVVSFQQGVGGYTGTLDTFIRRDVGRERKNQGGAELIQVQVGSFGGITDPLASNPLKAGLIKFNDIFGNGAGQVPLGQTITSATLRLSLQTDIIGPGSKTVYVHPLLADVPNYGTQDNAEEIGAVSFSHRALDVTDWGTVGGPPQRDVDYDSTKAIGTTFTANSGFNQDVDLDVTAIVADWSAGTLDNRGLYLMPGGASEALYFRSSEYSSSVYRPELVIEFDQPGNAFPSNGPYPYTERYSKWAQRNAFPVGALHTSENPFPSLSAEQRIQRYADAGFTSFNGLTPTKHTANFQEADRVGLDWQALAKNWADFSFFQAQIDHAMSIGNGPTAISIYDEPTDEDLADVVQRMNWTRSTYQGNLQDTGQPEPLIYANLSVPSIDVDQYLAQVNPDVLSYDDYPLFRDGTTKRDWLQTMGQMRELSLGNNVPLWMFNQAFGRDTAGNNILYRLPSESDIRFQAFSFLGQGGLGINYFLYISAIWPEAIIDSTTNQPTDLYYDLQKVTPEIVNLGRSLPMLRSVGDVRYLGDALTEFDGLQEFTGFNRLQDVSQVTFGTQISFFEDAAGEEYFMIVNLEHGADVSPLDGTDTLRLIFDLDVLQLERLSRLSGEVELLNTMLALSGTERYLDLTLLGGTGDLFKYSTGLPFAMVVPELLPGDFDGDLDVDSEDLAIWQLGYGIESGGEIGVGDANEDGNVDGGDFLIWQQNYTGPGPLPLEGSSVPEPSTSVLAITLASLFGMMRKRTMG